MKKLYSTFLLLCVLFASKAQTYYPLLDSVTNNWYLLANYIPVEPGASPQMFGCNYGFPPSFTSYTIFTTGDTIISGNTYKILEHNDYNNFNLCTYGYMREDTATRKVYFIDNIFSPEELLYDFSMQIGDSISLSFFQPGFNAMWQDGYYTLDSIGSTQVTAGVRPVYYLNCKTCPFSQTLEWVQGVGNLSHIVYTHSSNSLSWGWFTGNCQGFQYNSFEITLCYEHSQRVYFDSCARNFAFNNFCFAYYDSCNYWNICGGLDELSSVQSLAISPNPAMDEITLTVQSLNTASTDFILRNLSGKKVKSITRKLSKGTSKIKMSTKDLADGIYIIQCISKEGTLYRKLVVSRE